MTTKRLIPLFLMVAAAACSSVQPGLTPIFNGRDLTGWKTPRYPECWIAKGGILTVTNNAERKGENLNTVKSYRDFVCQVDFKFGQGTVDSGIFMRNDRDQIQIGISGSLKRDMTASPYIPGKGYPVEAQGVKKLLNLDDWNTLRIRAVGKTYTTWLNGVEVMNYTSDSAIEEGPLGIQLHGGRKMTIQYRNMAVTELIPDK
ncbi:MAG: DUF1080 domain-containing protein [Planctomycetes bacterium]|nr:DUF1080 domain-containing protein [Planctomycetota bacterium]